MAYTRVNGVRLFYERQGAGEPMLFVTGFAIPAAVFDPILPAYAEHFDCITYDNRGAGRSSAPLWPTSMVELAADAVGLMDRLDIDSAHVYGLSLGGMVAQEMALRFPERVRGLVLGCTTPGGPRAARPSLRGLAGMGRAMLGGLFEPGRPALAGAVFSPELRREQPERVLELLEGFGAHMPTPWGASYHFMASVYHDTLSRLPEMQAPTLVMHGACDAMDPLANSVMMAEAIPDAELALVPGAGHAYPLEAPDVSLDMLLDWLDRKGPIEAGRSREGPAAALEHLTRPFGLLTGSFRTGRSLPTYVADVLRGRRPGEADAALWRRAAALAGPPSRGVASAEDGSPTVARASATAR